MSDIFGIENFNVIEDEENYYYFRSLEPGDIEDLEAGRIKDEEGKYIRLRTDRERWEETNKGKNPRWTEKDEISLEQLYYHIKYNYSLQTNCISLTSSAAVAKMYGDQFSQRYVMITVPKKEMGERVYSAGTYVLTEIEKRVKEELEKELPEEVRKVIEEIDEAADDERLKEILKERFTSKEKIETKTPKMHEGIVYKAPTARISKYQALTEEQNLYKNKVIAKLTILEKSGIMAPIISHTVTNKRLITTMGGAFSSEEQTYYGDIEGERVTDISIDLLNIFALLQQVKGIDKEKLKKLQKELIEIAKNGKTIEIPKESNIRNNYKIEQNPTVEEIYELTEGKLEYGKTNTLLKQIHYLTQSRIKAREFSKVLREETKNNPEYEEIYKYIEENGFEIETPIVTRTSNVGYKINETVNIDISKENLSIVEIIKGLPNDELEEIVKSGKNSKLQEIIREQIEGKEEISEERYYAEAIISQYNWKSIGIERFESEIRKEFIKRLEDKKCIEIYKELKARGIPKEQIPIIILNIVTRQGIYEKYKEGKLEELLKENQEILQNNINIELLEGFLGYYDIEGTEIKLKEYQQRASNKTDEILEKEKFVANILPTGSGKSYIAMVQMLKEKYGIRLKEGKGALYLAPSREILDQIQTDLIEEVLGLRVIGDIVLEKGGIGKNRTKEKVLKEEFPSLEFDTYASLKTRELKKYGLIVLDELHRTGAEEWGVNLEELLRYQDEDINVLGITATPVRDVDNKNMADEIARLMGYSEEKIKNDEHIAMNMSLIEGIRNGIIVNPKTIFFEYTLMQMHKYKELYENIEDIEDEEVRKEKLEKLEEYLKETGYKLEDIVKSEDYSLLNLSKTKGISEILEKNLKKGRKIYSIFTNTR